MKNFLFGITATILIVIFTINFKENTKEEIYSPKKYQTSQEIKEAVIQNKLELRKTGWAKPDKPSEFLEFHKRIRTKEGEIAPSYPMNYKFTELNKASLRIAALKSATVKLDWIERGPGNVSGRTRGLIIDPDDHSGNTWFTGSVGGGIWKTTNAGNSWINLTPNFPTLSTVTIDMSLSNTQVIYAGTGEGFGNADAVIGDGIFKSIDKGETWQQLLSTASNDDFRFVNRLIVDPQNENIVLAVTNTSIQKTNNGGNTWRMVFDDSRRVQHIVYEPGNFNIMYASVYGKGVIKSIDKGENWSYVFSNNTGRIELAIAPSDPTRILALNENSELFVSNDAGTTWTLSVVTSGSREKFLSSQGWYDNTLAVDPENKNTVIIGGVNLFKVELTKISDSPTSIYSADTLNTAGFIDFINFGANYLGGGLEINETNKNYNTIAIVFGPGKSQKAHRFLVPQGATSGIAANDHTYTDYVNVPFEAWDTGNNRQLMISFRDQDRNGVFNLTDHDDELLIGREYIWINDVSYSTSPSPSITKNGGHEFNEIAFAWPVTAIGATWNPDAFPDAQIIINRTEVFAQELSSKKIADWAGSGAPYVHADLHNIQYTKMNSGKTRIVVANDGGVGFSDDNGTTWTNPTNGFNTTQFYGVDKHPTQSRYIGGLQDNGSWFSDNEPDHLSFWTEATGGDGFDAVWHATDPQKMITSIYYNQLYFSPDGGQSWTNIEADLSDVGSSKAPFITQIGYAVNNPNKLLVVGSSGVSYSEDFGISWKTSLMPEGTWGWSGDGFVEPSLANPDMVWAASRMSETGKVHLSTDGGKTFSETNGFSESMGILSGLATHPTHENTAFALFSYQGEPKILRTKDGGNNWEDLSGFEGENSNNGFPDVAVYSLLVMPNNSNEIWAGTEIGLFVSKNNGQTWEYANNGLPAVSIWEMKIRGDQIVMATHGRGIWTAKLPNNELALYAPTLLGVGVSPSNKTAIQFIAPSAFDSIAFIIDSLLVETLYVNYSSPGTYTHNLNQMLDEGEHVMQMIAYKNGNQLKSASTNFYTFNVNAAVNAYENNFDEGTTDFSGEGFTIKSYPAIGPGMAIHTEHPYPDNRNLAYYLRTPLIVKGENESNATRLFYSDIPMIEEGESGSRYGSPDFYDYVVVEGSKDGINWLPLADGYDFRKIKLRASSLGLDINSTPFSTLFTNHDVNLLETFNANDTIMIRFRLFSDQNTNGWGWAIDKVRIFQDIRVSNPEITDKSIQLYPIPCNDFVTVDVGNRKSEEWMFTIYDLSGRLIIKEKHLINSAPVTINTSALNPAVYILEISNGIVVERKRFQVNR